MEVRSTAARATQRGWCYCTCSTDYQDTVGQSRIRVGMRKGGETGGRRGLMPAHGVEVLSRCTFEHCLHKSTIISRVFLGG